MLHSLETKHIQNILTLVDSFADSVSCRQPQLFTVNAIICWSGILLNQDWRPHSEVSQLCSAFCLAPVLWLASPWTAGKQLLSFISKVLKGSCCLRQSHVWKHLHFSERLGMPLVLHVKSSFKGELKRFLRFHCFCIGVRLRSLKSTFEFVFIDLASCHFHPDINLPQLSVLNTTALLAWSGWPSSAPITETGCQLLVCTAAQGLFSCVFGVRPFAGELWVLAPFFFRECRRMLVAHCCKYMCLMGSAQLPPLIICWYSYRDVRKYEGSLQTLRQA